VRHHGAVGPGPGRVATAALLGALVGAGAVSLMSRSPAPPVPNVVREQPLTAALAGVDVTVRHVAGPPENPNAVVLEVDVLPADRLPLERREHAVELVPASGEQTRAASSPCVLVPEGSPAYTQWRCGFVVDDRGIWRFDVVVSDVAASGAGGGSAPLGVVRVVVDVLDAVKLEGLHGTSGPGGDGIPGAWFLGTAGLVALGAGVGVRTLVRQRN
jgi:hypothetical protein